MFKLFTVVVSLLLTLESLATSSMCLSFYKVSSSQSIVSAIEETLYIGVPISVKPFSANGNRNSLWLVTLENPKTKQTVTALFKPRFPGDGDGWNRVTMEYASYEVAKLLGMENIPPVAYRYNLTINGQFFHEGSIQYFVKGATLLKEVEKNDWNVDPEHFISDARVLDVLLQNPDRHAGNFIIGPHWIDGARKPFLIDQAANMRKGTNMRLSTKGPFNDKLITEFNPKTVQKLRELTAKTLGITFPFMTSDEVQRVLHHRDGIIKFIDSRSSDK